jgi:hypothetical protein
VLIASDTRVQMARFDQADIAHAQFVIDRGRVRFVVEHPQGARADYVFRTATANIAVRGTEGDIGFAPDGLTVNVYNSSTQDAPVEITLVTGPHAGTTLQVFAGQSLVAKLVNGALTVQINRLTDAAINAFSELGVPTTIAQASDSAMARARALLPAVPAIPSVPKLPSIPGFPH